MIAKWQDLPSRWHSVYWFPSNRFVGEEPSEYDMKSYWNGNTLILESEQADDKAYMLIRLRFQDDVVSGGWYETTSPKGEFKGAQYQGFGQLIIDPDTYNMEGKWAGAGFDHKLKRLRVYAGNWEITPISK